MTKSFAVTDIAYRLDQKARVRQRARFPNRSFQVQYRLGTIWCVWTDRCDLDEALAQLEGDKLTRWLDRMRKLSASGPN